MTEACGVAGGELQRHRPAEGHSQDGRLFEEMPLEQLAEVVGQILKAKPPPQGETVVLASKLKTDDAKMPGEQPRERAQQLVAAGQAGNQNQRGSVAPFAKLCRVIRQMGITSAATARTEFCTAFRKPLRGNPHFSVPPSSC